MRTHSAWYTCLLLAVFSATLLFSCSGNDRQYDTLYLYLDNEPKGLDPALSTDFGTGQICALLFDNLVRFGKETDLQPGIAKSWDISEDGLTYTFQLHEGFRFSNGTEITSSVVKQSIERVLNPETRSLRTWLFTPVQGARAYIDGEASEVSGIQADNPYQVVITLKEPFAPFLGFLAMPAAAIVPPEVADRLGKNFAESPVGSGPWIFEEWQHDSFIRLRANPDYFYGKPKINKAVLKVIPEAFSLIAEFETGQLDLMDVPQAEFERWTESEKWQNYLHVVNEMNLFYIGLNCNKPPFDDVRVRRAMSYALDAETILNTTLNGAGVLSHGPIPPGLASYDSTRKRYGYNPDKAKELLAEAGYPRGFTIELWQSQNSTLNQITEAFQAYYARIGIEVNIVRTDFNLLMDAIRQGEPDMYYMNWWADYPDAENFLYPLFHSSQAARRNRYANPEVDSLIEQNRVTVDPQERIKLARKAEKLIYEDAPYVFLWHEITYELTQPWLKNYRSAIMFNAQKYTEVELKP
ncbi:MAG: Heme-binding protein A [Candidatus Marinimicrobia bacterium]|nr:Heme-binding protein A [Candidatus Neomarinimicrobiota bacterium]